MNLTATIKMNVKISSTMNAFQNQKDALGATLMGLAVSVSKRRTV